MYIMLLAGFRADKTQTGHILGPAAQRGLEALPERQLSAVECALLRFLTHAALYLAANDPAQVGNWVCLSLSSLLLFLLDCHYTENGSVSSLSAFFSITATLTVRSEDECGRLLQFLLAAVEFGV